MVTHVLTTGRLELRPVRALDQGELHAHWTAPEVRRFLFDGAVLPPDEVAEVISESERDFAASGYGLWIVRERGGGDALVGTVGLRPLEDLGLEVHYSLAPEAWGRGYATEAARAVIDHALVTLGLAEVLAEVDEGNTASAAIIERLGMTPFATVPGELGPMTRYRLSGQTDLVRQARNAPPADRGGPPSRAPLTERTRPPAATDLSHDPG